MDISPAEMQRLLSVRVELHRCDKIWETLQLIKQLARPSQAPGTSTQQSVQIKQEIPNEVSPPEPEESCTEETTAPLEEPAPYVPFCPPAANNAQVPNFGLSVMSKKKLYPCNNCDKSFVEKRALRIHSEKVHGIIIPYHWRKKANMYVRNVQPPVVNGGIKPVDIASLKPAITITPIVKPTVQSSIQAEPSARSSSPWADYQTAVNKELEAQAAGGSDKSLSVTRNRRNSLKKNYADIEDETFNRLTENGVATPPPEPPQKPKRKTMQKPLPVKMNYTQLEDGNAVVCKLCARITTHLKRHFMDFHKVARIRTTIIELYKDQIIQETIPTQGAHKLKPIIPAYVRDIPTVNHLQETITKEIETRVLPPYIRTPNKVAPFIRPGPASVKQFYQPPGPTSVPQIHNRPGPKCSKRPLEPTDHPAAVVQYEVKRVNPNEPVARYEIHKVESAQSPLASITAQPRNAMKKRRRTLIGFTDDQARRRCKICLGTYIGDSSLHKHMMRHKYRGETMENIRFKPVRYKNSPLKTPIAEWREKVRASNVAMATYVPGAANGQASDDNSRRNLRSIEPVTCACGRTFRNAHTLFMHQSTCKSPSSSGEKQQQSPSDKQQQFLANVIGDKDFSGISITIKKKNDSYQVVNRDSDNEERSRTHLEGLVKIPLSNLDKSPAVDDPLAFPLLTKIKEEKLDEPDPEAELFSKDHSVLTIQRVEEDMDVDVSIDDDSVLSSFNEGPFEEESADDDELQLRASDDKKVPSLKQLCRAIATSENLFAGQLNEYPCLRCAKLFNNEADATTHFTTKHWDGELEVCLCGAKFPDREAFDSHVLTAHPQWPECGYCKQSFDTVAKYIEHRCSVQSGEPFDDTSEEIDCSICNLNFRKIQQYDAHVRENHPDDSLPYKCYKCELRFDRRTKRKHHFNEQHSHSQCEVCNKKFHSILKVKHEAYHKGLGFPCHTCKKAYPEKSTLARHLEVTHSDITSRLMECPVCKIQVKIKTWKRHIATHNEGVEDCQICLKSFADEQALEKHITKHHGGDYPWNECSTCGVMFMTKKLLQKHIDTDSCMEIETAENVTLRIDS